MSFWVLAMVLALGLMACGKDKPTAPGRAPDGIEMVFVEGGRLPNIGNGALNVSSFYIGRYEVTWGQWQEVRSWAVWRGYDDLDGKGAGCTDDHPVLIVSWYDAVKWCNALSEMEGLTPVYTVNGSVYRHGERDDVGVDSGANGYRLPTDAEWEYAARGGRRNRGYTYSGSNDVHAVGWYQGNSGRAACQWWESRGTWPVGRKQANELGLHDMSGNVREWCCDWHPGREGFNRILRGGSWYDLAVGCRVNYRSYHDPGFRSLNLGFRLASSAGR